MVATNFGMGSMSRAEDILGQTGPDDTQVVEEPAEAEEPAAEETLEEAPAEEEEGLASEEPAAEPAEEPTEETSVEPTEEPTEEPSEVEELSEEPTEDAADAEDPSDEPAEGEPADGEPAEGEPAEGEPEECEPAEGEPEEADLAEAPTFTDGTLLAESADYNISLSFSADAMIPDGATLTVFEIDPNSEAYRSYMETTASKIFENKDTEADTLPYARFFDITILNADGEAVEPAAPVQVVIDLKDQVLATEDVEFAAVHFVEEETKADGETEIVETELVDIETGAVEASDEESTVSFDANSFSTYGVIYYYTVDFYYGDAEYHMNGGSEMLMSDLFTKLGIEKNVSDITNVEFTDETLVKFIKEDADWTIKSLAPFSTSETLTITFADGTVIVIDVEDATYRNRTPEGNINWELQTNGTLTIRLVNSATSGGFTTNRTSQTAWNSFWAISSSASTTIRSEVTKVIITKNQKDVGINVDEMAIAYMFSGFTNLESVEIQDGALSGSPSNIRNMFDGCSKLSSITGISNLDVSNVGNMQSMFQNCSSLKELDLSGWETDGAVTYMQDLFNGCSSLEKIVLGSDNGTFKTRPSTSSSAGGAQMQRMFNGCSSLKHLELVNCIFDCGRDTSGWGKITDSFRSAGYKNSLETLIIKNTEFPNAKDFSNAFSGCPKLTQASITHTTPGNVAPDAVDMSNMFANSFTSPVTSGTDGEGNPITIVPTLDVSGFGKLEHIVNMDGFVNGCTSLKTLNIDNLDNSRIGPTSNSGHTSSDPEASTTGASDFGRMLDIHTCTALETLSAKKSNVWMVHNNRGVPGSEYYNAAFENDVYYFTDKEMEFASDVGPTVTIDSDRDYIDLITDRDGSNMPTINPAQSTLPDASTNINITNGDLNKIGTTTNRAGMLAPGVYTLKDTERTEPAGAPMCDTYFRIAYIGEVPYKVEGIDPSDPDLVKVDGSDNTYITTTNKVWPSSGDVVIDRTSKPIEVTYENAAIDMNGRRYNVVITITKITFKDVGNVPTDPGSARRRHDGNKYVPASRTYYRPILQANKSDGLQFQNYVWTGNPIEPWNKTNCLSKGSGTDIEFTISIEDAPDDTSFVFKGEDLDVPYSQNWHNSPVDACLDTLPERENIYGIGGEGFILGDGNVLGTVKFADHTGLVLVEGNKVITTGSDPDTTWSEFTVKADAQGANYTWTSGISCTSYALRNTKAQNAGSIKLQPEVLKQLLDGTLSADKFEFALEEVSKSPDTAPSSTNNNQTTTNAADGKVTFAEMEFKPTVEDGYFPGTSATNEHNVYTYTYKVYEKIPTDAIDVTGENGATYKVKDGILYDQKEHKFTIVITPPKNETEMLRGIKAEIYIDKTPGAGVTPDKTYWHKDKACVDCSNGTPTDVAADKWYDKDGNEIADPNPLALTDIKFENKKITTELKIPVQKILQGRSWKDTDEFAAGLVLFSTDAPMPANTQTIGVGEKVSKVVINNDDTPVKNDADKIIGYSDTFDSITYKLEDVGKSYTYHVRELTPAESSVAAVPGVTYDEEKFDVQVAITLDDTDPANPKLVATATYKDDNGQTVTISSFTNIYDAEETDYKMEAVKDFYDVTKDEEIELTKDQFTFAVRPIGENAKIAPMPEGTEGTGADRVFYKGNEDDGDIEFEQNPDGIKDGMVFNYKALLEAGIDDAALHSDEGVDFEYVIYEIIPGTEEGIAKGMTLADGDILVNNEDGTYSVIGEDEEIIYDGVHHTRKITVKVIQGDATETGETHTYGTDEYDVYKDFNDVKFYERGGKAYKVDDDSEYTPDLETLDVEGHEDDHTECYYISEKDGTPKNVPMHEVSGYDPTRHHFKVNEHGEEVKGAPIFVNYRFDQKYVDLKVKKVWDDADDQDKIRPESIKVTIKSDEGDFDPTDLELKGSTWEASEKLPVYEFDIKTEKLKEITYSVEESDVPAGYNESYDKNNSVIKLDPDEDEFVLTITNKHTPGEGAADGDETYGLKGEPQTGTPKYDVNPKNPVTPTSLVKPDVPGSTISDDGKTVTIPGEGKYVLNDDGTVTFTPEPDFVGDPTPIDIACIDKQGNPATATYTPHVVDPTDEQEVSRTINFTYETKDGKRVTNSLTQKGTLTRKALKVDSKTGEVTEWGPWLPYTFPAVKNPDEEAGPEWATQDIAGELTVTGPGAVEDVYIIYHKKSDPTPPPAPTPAPPEPVAPSATPTGDRNDMLPWIALFVSTMLLAIALKIRTSIRHK